MARKKKTETVEPAAEREPLAPVKSAEVRQSRGTAKVERDLVPADYETIREAIVARHGEKLTLVREMEAQVATVKASRKKLAEIQKATEADLSTMSSGKITETLPCLEILDWTTGMVTKIEEDTGRVYESREMHYGEKQRELKFQPRPENDCLGCKLFNCVRTGQGPCQNFADCFECQDFRCGRADTGGRCGFNGDRNWKAREQSEELRNPLLVTSWQEWGELQPDVLRVDCFFCRSAKCNADGGPLNCDDTTRNCYLCDLFACDTERKGPKGCPKRDNDDVDEDDAEDMDDFGDDDSE